MKHFSETINENLKDFIEESMMTPNGFVILKPEFLNYDQEWKDIIKNKGWDFIHSERITLSPDQAKDLYEPHREKDFYNDLCDYMSSGECICCTCKKNCSDPIEEMNKIKEIVRKKWAINDMKNAMHSSDSLENVERESKICLH